MKKSYSRERMTNLLAVVSLVQGGLYLGFIVYFLELFLRDVPDLEQRDRFVLHHLTASVHTLFVVLLFLAGFVHFAWIVSSIYALLGNKKGNERSVSQYVAMTSLVSLMDIIFPFVVLPSTYTVFKMALESQTFHDDRLDEPILMTEADYGKYFWLIMTFIRGGCFTFAIDVFSATIAYQRFMELHELGIKIRGNIGMASKDAVLDDALSRPMSDLEMDVEKDEKDEDSERETTTYVPPEDQTPPEVGVQDNTNNVQD